MRLLKTKIEIPNPNYSTTTGAVISFNTLSIPEDFEMYEIDDS
jgi:hypothetical protein